MLKNTKLLCLSMLMGLFVFATAAVAQQQEPAGRDVEKERAIHERLEEVAPSSVATFEAATSALDKDDYAEAVRLYREVYEEAPEFDPLLRRLGFSLVRTGSREDGLALLEKAIEIERSPENLASLAEALAHPGAEQKSSKSDKQRALGLAREASEMAEAADDPSYAAVLAQISLELEDERNFRDAVKTLADRHPNHVATHYYQAIRAAMDEDWVFAEEEIRRAGALGLPAEAVQGFLESGVGTRATVWRYTFYVLYLAAAWALGLVLLFVVGKIISNITLRSVENSDPNDVAGAKEMPLRKLYRSLINFAGFYYYISLPVVICLVVLLAASVFYGFLLLGRIPIKLVLVLGICALLTIYQMIRSLFTRRTETDPGRSLRVDEAPGLWALTREVAETIGTRPISEIRVTPGTELAVYERGSYAERKQDRAERILILGVGVLNGFSQNSFRAVLAHEYGHFSNRDTAGGDVAIRVNRDMINFAHAMIASGQATWWNIAFQFLRVYHFIFRRISHGATRLQEMLADRVAVYNYGAKAFKDGLSHAIRRDIEFNHLASKEIGEAVNARRAVQNLYELAEAKENEEAKTIEEAFNEVISRPTTEDDTHPSPVNRFRLASRIISKGEPSYAGMVWDLFSNREALTSEMSSLVEAEVRAAEAA